MLLILSIGHRVTIYIMISTYRWKTVRVLSVICCVCVICVFNNLDNPTDESKLKGSNMKNGRSLSEYTMLDHLLNHLLVFSEKADTILVALIVNPLETVV